MSEVGAFFTDPALKRVRMRLFACVVVIFTLVCSGSFGMEEVVSSAGPGFTILMIVLLPFIWSVAMAFLASELGSAIPEEGGFGRWVRHGLGEYWGLQSSWWWTPSLYVDSSVYIVLALGYIQTKWGFSDNWRWLFGIGLVAFFTFINIRGLDLTGKALIVVQAVVMVPFVIFVVWAFAKSGANPVSPFLPKGETMITASNLGLAVMMWRYSGYESMSTVAAEVENPQRVIPRAIMVAVPIVIATYALATMAGIRAAGVGNWLNMTSDASAGGSAVDFVKSAELTGGAVLMWLMLAFAIASNLGLYTGYLATGSRPSYQLSRDRLYPKFMGRAHRRWGTPWIAILTMVVGGLVVQASRWLGGVLVAAACVIALCLIYTHADFRTANVWVWSAPIVLAVLGAVFAGLALKAEIEPVGRETLGAEPGPPSVEAREPLVVGAPPSV